MDFLKGKVLRGGEEVAANVEVSLSVSDASAEDGWNGSFQLPQGPSFDREGDYRIELEDGRSGPITIRNVSVGENHPTSVGFWGAGPLD